MALKIGIPKESGKSENRVAMVPETVKRMLGKSKGLEIIMEKEAGLNAGIDDVAFKDAGAKLATAAMVWKSDIIFKVSPPSKTEQEKLKKGQLLVGHLDPLGTPETIKSLAKKRVDAIAVEKIPRTSRAQSMDALSSQANVGGYRAVLEATQHFKKFFPLMMTAAGSSKPAKVIILGVGVAGLQAIATAKRLGAQVEAFDVRPEVAEQIESLGAKAIAIDIGESGSGEGGYAKELSAKAKKKQQEELQKILAKADVVITTAQIPGKKAPVLVTEQTVKNMKTGSVIVDMAAASGGNCPLTKADKAVVQDGVTIIGYTNYPSMVAEDSSMFYSKNLMNIFNLLLKDDGELNFDLEDDIINAALVSFNGKVRD
jgi:NAD(P) transhydrogenase subunit alpha